MIYRRASTESARDADLAQLSNGDACQPSGVCRQAERGADIRFAIPILCRLRLVHPVHETIATDRQLANAVSEL